LARLAAAGRGLLIATHDLEQARSWDRVLCLNRRQIAYGEPAEVLSVGVLESTYGGDVVALPGRRGVLPPHHHERSVCGTTPMCAGPRTVPDRGASSPSSTRNSVVLPPPLGPSTPTRWPGST